MPAVQRRPVPRGAKAVVSAGGVLLTVLATTVVLLLLTVPNRLEEVGPDTVVRLPVELVAYLALVLLVPSRMRRLLVAAAGVVLALVAVFTLLDIGFLQTLNRPFDPMIDWQYADSLV